MRVLATGQYGYIAGVAVCSNRWREDSHRGLCSLPHRRVLRLPVYVSAAGKQLLRLVEGNPARGFREKPQVEDGWLNSGFFFFNRELFGLHGDECVLEGEPLERLAAEGQLAVCKRQGFSQCMDTLRDAHLIENLWHSGMVPWMVLAE